MEKRASDRIYNKIPIRFLFSNTFVAGTATDLSENGMFINTEVYFPMQSKFEILIPLKEEVLKVPVKLIRLAATGNIHKGMGVKLLNLPKKYLELIMKHKLGCQN